MRLILAGGLALAAFASATGAQARPAECLMIINGRTLIDGRCEFDRGPDGSFRLESATHVGHVMVNTGGAGEGMWTTKPEVRSNFRNTSALRRNGACWTSGNTTFCAWSLGQRPQAQAPLNPPAQPFAQAPARASGGACPPPGSARSMNSNQPAAVQFVNNTGGPLRIFWLDFQGQRKLYKELMPGERYVQQTFVTHPWIAVDQQGGCRGGVFFPNPGNNLHMVGAAPAQAQRPTPPRPAPQIATRPAAQPAAQPLLVEWERNVAGWKLIRYQNSTTQRLARCDADRNFPDGNFLRFSAAQLRDRVAITVSFSSTSLDMSSLGPRFQIRYWVDDENATQTTTATVDSQGLARFSERGDEPGSEDAWANGNDFAIAIGQRVLGFPLKGSNPMFKALLDCANK